MTELSRRRFLGAAAASGFAAASSTPLDAFAAAKNDGRPIVYWTPEISSESLRRVYRLVSANVTGKVALKLHTGEPHGPNILPPAWIEALQADIPQSTIVECNVLYKSPRQTTEGHRRTL